MLIYSELVQEVQGSPHRFIPHRIGGGVHPPHPLRTSEQAWNEEHALTARTPSAPGSLPPHLPRARGCFQPAHAGPAWALCPLTTPAPGAHSDSQSCGIACRTLLREPVWCSSARPTSHALGYGPTPSLSVPAQVPLTSSAETRQCQLFCGSVLPLLWVGHHTSPAGPCRGPSLLMQPGSKDKGLAWPLPQGMSLQRLLVMLGSSPQTERQRDREANAAGGKEATPPEMGQQTSLWRRRSLPLSKKTPRTLEPQHPRVPQGLPSPSHHDVRDTSWACFSLLPQFR